MTPSCYNNSWDLPIVNFSRIRGGRSARRNCGFVTPPSLVGYRTRGMPRKRRSSCRYSRNPALRIRWQVVGAVVAIDLCYIFKGDDAFDIFAGEYGGLFELNGNTDVGWKVHACPTRECRDLRWSTCVRAKPGSRNAMSIQLRSCKLHGLDHR
jgi:hypothetical protein